MPLPPCASYPKNQRVYAVLRWQIMEGRFARGSKLPPGREIARTFGVSLITVLTAQKRLENEGLVARIARQGVFVTKGPKTESSGPDLEARDSRRRAEQVADSIAEEIFSGDLRVGDTLPLKKALRFKFGTSSQNLAVALKILEGKKLIHAKGPGYKVGIPESLPKGSHSAVIVIPAMIPQTGNLVKEAPSGDIFPSFEKELAVHGVTFAGVRRSEKPGLHGPGYTSLGGIYSCSSERWQRSFLGESVSVLCKELKRLSRMKTPIVFYNAAVVLHRFPDFDFRPYRNVYALRINNWQMGELGGNYLAMHGHKNIAFFSYSFHAWGNQRLEGLSRAIDDLFKGKGSVKDYHAGVDPTAFREYDASKMEVYTAPANRLLDDLFKGYRFREANAYRRLLQSVYELMVIDHYQVALAPLFQQALKQPEITAWVSADEFAGYAAARYLSQRRIRVPNRLSLLALDDFPLLRNQGTTCCDPRFGRMGYLAAHCILGDVPVAKDEKGMVECQSQIIERGSVARVSDR